MIMHLYWESMVWRIIANGVAYVKYKNAYKIKLMVLNCHVFPARLMGDNVVCHCACIAARH